MFKRRLGTARKETASRCLGGHACPDILELQDGDFAVIGEDITVGAAEALPPGSGCGPRERIIRIPRRLLMEALADIPSPP